MGRQNASRVRQGPTPWHANRFSCQPLGPCISAMTAWRLSFRDLFHSEGVPLLRACLTLTLTLTLRTLALTLTLTLTLTITLTLTLTLTRCRCCARGTFPWTGVKCTPASPPRRA